MDFLYVSIIKNYTLLKISWRLTNLGEFSHLLVILVEYCNIYCPSIIISMLSDDFNDNNQISYKFEMRIL